MIAAQRRKGIVLHLCCDQKNLIFPLSLVVICPALRKTSSSSANSQEVFRPHPHRSDDQFGVRWYKIDEVTDSVQNILSVDRSICIVLISEFQSEQNSSMADLFTDKHPSFVKFELVFLV